MSQCGIDSESEVFTPTKFLHFNTMKGLSIDQIMVFSDLTNNVISFIVV